MEEQENTVKKGPNVRVGRVLKNCFTMDNNDQITQQVRVDGRGDQRGSWGERLGNQGMLEPV